MIKFNSVKELFKGKYLGLYSATYTDNDRVKNYEIISRRPLNNFNLRDCSKGDAVTLICFNEDKSKLLIQAEFRMTVGQVVYDFPSGLIEKGEFPEETARRELEEETGLELVKIEDICPPCYTSVGMTNETVIPVYCVAKGELKGSNSDFEITEPFWITKKEAREILKDTKNNFDEKVAYTGLSNRLSAELYNWCKE